MSILSALLALIWNEHHLVHFLSMDFWIFLSILIYAWVVQRNSRKIESLCRHLFSFRELSGNKGTKNTRNVSGKIWNVSFLLLSVVNVSWLLYMLWMYSGWHYSFEHHHEVHWGCNYLLLVCAFFTVLFYGIKSVLIPVVAGVFDESRFGLLLWRMDISYDFLLAVCSFPFVMIFLYTGGWLQHLMFWIVVVLCFVAFIIKVLKAVIVGRYYSRFSYVHIFSYFCGLEILLPLVLWQIVFDL